MWRVIRGGIRGDGEQVLMGLATGAEPFGVVGWEQGAASAVVVCGGGGRWWVGDGAPFPVGYFGFG